MKVLLLLKDCFQTEAQPPSQPPPVFGPETEHDWCYFYEKAGLARQQGDWKQVVALGERAFKQKNKEFFRKNAPELLPFIEGYAHVGNWKRAVELSKISYKVSKDYVGPLLCQLWERIETGTVTGVERSAALAEIQQTLACPLP